MPAQVNIDIPIFLSNAAAAFGLNMSVFLLIGKTSALTMNIAGVIKDWMLIGLSVLLFKAVGTALPPPFPHHVYTSSQPCSGAYRQTILSSALQAVTSINLGGYALAFLGVCW